MHELPTTLLIEDTPEEMSYQWTRVTLNQILGALPSTQAQDFPTLQVQALVALVVTLTIPVSTTPSHKSRGRRKWQRGERGSSGPGMTILDLEDSPIVRADALVQTQGALAYTMSFVVDGESLLVIDRVRP